MIISGGKSMSYMTAYESRLRSHVLGFGHLERDEALSLPLADVLAYVRADSTLWASWCRRTCGRPELPAEHDADHRL